MKKKYKDFKAFIFAGGKSSRMGFDKALINHPHGGNWLNHKIKILNNLKLDTYLLTNHHNHFEEVDVLANDNDGMGVVWRFQDLSEHYRFFTMVDSGNPPNGELGPWRKLEVRLGKGAGQKLPFYDTLDIEKGKSYTEGKLTHWKIEVTGDRFRVEVDGKKAVEGKDNTYNKAGYIGFILYAQSGVFFDNLVITDTFPVNPQDAFTTTWSQIKKLRLKNQ